MYKLKKYQFESASHLLNYGFKLPFVVLNDQIGSGKTVTFLCFLNELYLNNSIKCLIIVSKNILNQWEDDLKNFYPRLKYTVAANKKKLNNVNILITTEISYKYFINDYDCICIDEYNILNKIKEPLDDKKIILISYIDYNDTSICEKLYYKMITCNNFYKKYDLYNFFENVFTLVKHTFPDDIKIIERMFHDDITLIIDEYKKKIKKLPKSERMFFNNVVIDILNIMDEYLKYYNNIVINSEIIFKNNISNIKIKLDDMNYSNILFKKDEILKYLDLIKQTHNSSAIYICNAAKKYKFDIIMTIINYSTIKNSNLLFNENIIYLKHDVILKSEYNIISNNSNDNIKKLILNYDISSIMNITRIKIDNLKTINSNTLSLDDKSNIIFMIRLIKLDKLNKLKQSILPNSNNENIISRIDALQKNINILEQEYNDILNDDCNICAIQIKIPVLYTCCQSIICSDCYEKLKDKCPICREQNPYTTFVDSFNKLNESKKKNKNKNEKILCLHEKCYDIINKSVKTVIYSSSYNILNFFPNNNFYTLKGNYASRIKIISDFKNNNKALFLSDKVDFSGLRLECATDIILLNNDLDINKKKQIIGRAIRLGRSTELPLTIHEFNIIE